VNGRPAFTIPETEVYLNHVLTGPRTPLLALQYTDPKSGRVYFQEDAGWYKSTGKGMVFYFMAGHHARDFEVPAYAQILANAIVFPMEKPVK
jgi:type 1 glutamine amidotransferase